MQLSSLVHDAARPVLPEEVIERVLTALNEGWDGAIPVLPLADTVKRVESDRVVETLERESLAVAQTPQAFLAPVLRGALGDAQATDCSALVEARGGRIKAVPGDPRLVKVTEPADLELVEGLARSRRRVIVDYHMHLRAPYGSLDHMVEGIERFVEWRPSAESTRWDSPSTSTTSAGPASSRASLTGSTAAGTTWSRTSRRRRGPAAGHA